jgi:hypothetical protein
VRDDDDLWDDGPDLLDGPPPKSAKSKRARRKAVRAKRLFVRLPYPESLQWPLKLGTAGMAVLTYLVHAKWQREQDGKDPRKIPVSSKALCEAGVSRHAKRRGLRRLRSLGWVRDVERNPGCNPIVQLTLPVAKPRR